MIDGDPREPKPGSPEAKVAGEGREGAAKQGDAPVVEVPPDREALVAAAQVGAAADAKDAVRIEEIVEGHGLDQGKAKKRVESQEVKGEAEALKWIELYKQIFIDPGDMEPDEAILDRVRTGKIKLYFISFEGKDVGIRYVSIKGDAAYVPYGGIIEDLRDKNIYTQGIAANEEQLIMAGVKIVFNDCEDPGRFEALREANGVDAGDEAGKAELLENVKRRLKFFMRNGYLFVDDPDLKYRRPGSDDDQKIQSYDLAGFKILGQENEWAKYVDTAKGTITKEGYRKLYIALMQCDQCMDTEEELRRTRPAIDSFLRDLDASPKNEFNLYRPEKRPDNPKV